MPEIELEIKNYVRRPFPVKVVEVTVENLHAVAKWCGGSVRSDRTGKQYVNVKVSRPLTPRQTQAFVGDRVLYAETGFKVYTPKAFKDSFELVEDDPGVVLAGPEEGLTVGEQVPDTVVQAAKNARPKPGPRKAPAPQAEAS